MGKNDPVKLPRWSLPQALAWMIYKTPKAVPWAEGKDVFDVTNEALRRDEACDATGPSPTHRRNELYERLCDGTLTAYGIKQDQSEHSPIPPWAWETIDCFFNYGEQCDATPDDVYRSSESLPRYRDVFVRPQDVLVRWHVGFESSQAGAPEEARAIKSDRLTRAARLARELKAIYPGGRPPMSVKQITSSLIKRPDIGKFGDTTLKKAMRLAFPNEHE
jgi:hypothetical protein